MKFNVKTAFLHLWQEWIRPILIVLVICGSFRSAVADWNDVPTGSMKPNIVEGDRILVDKTAYGLRVPFTSWWLLDFAGPQRGDVVVFFSPGEGVRMVKRVVGLPGDRIEIRDNRLFINGTPASYESLDSLDEEVVAAFTEEERARHRFASENVDGRRHPVMSTPRRPSRRDFGPIEVPEKQYFVLGDNRDNSRDSRWFGCIKRGSIVGRATAVIFSVDLENHYFPRWDRFFRSLP